MIIKEIIDRLLEFNLEDEVEGYAIVAKTDAPEFCFDSDAPDGHGFEVQEILLAKGTTFSIEDEEMHPAARAKVLLYGGSFPPKPAR